MNTFSIGGAIAFAWRTFKKRPWVLIGAVIVFAAANILLSMLTEASQEGVLAAVTGVANFIVSSFIGLGLLAFFLKAHDQIESVEIKDLWHTENFWKYIGVTLLGGFIFAVLFLPFAILFILRAGTAFLSGSEADVANAFVAVGAVGWVVLAITILISVYVSIALMFGSYAVVDRSLGPIDALKNSVRITKGARLKMIGLLLLLGLINVAGALALFVGLLVTIPLSMIAIVHVYRALSGAPAPEVQA